MPLGKTSAIEHMIFQLGSRNIPFMVLELSKTEYRSIKTLGNSRDPKICRIAKEIEVYTPGNEELSPLRFNPLEIPPNISVDEHIENIMTCFRAAMPISGPLPALLSEGLERVYEDHPDPAKPPVMADLLAAVESILAAKGYSGETNSDIRAALEVRIGLLIRRIMGQVFQCRHSVPYIGHLMRVPSIIELDRLTQEHACLLSLFLLSAIRAYIKVTPRSKNRLRFVIFI